MTAEGQREPQVVVVGSANVDRTVRVDGFPRPGETVMGSELATTPGGKGLNQAVAAARMGAAFAFVGAVGDDRDGALLRDRLRAEGIVDHTVTVPVATGAASIVVDASGENTIVVSPGANHAIPTDHLDAVADLIGGAAVVLTQLETDLDVVARVLALASGTGVLTPAPVQNLPAGFLADVDLLTLNEVELATLSGQPDVAGVEGAMAAAATLDVATVVVTLGAAGAVVVTGDDRWHLPAPAVEVVDTTGAGDTFCGVLAAVLARGDDIEMAARTAVTAGALSVTRAGAQEAMPTADRVTVVHSPGQSPLAGPSSSATLLAWESRSTPPDA